MVVIFHSLQLVAKKVKVKLHGACADCKVNQMTLKNGVETTIKKYAPEIEVVESVLPLSE
jgi:Fe-S cluster biogenesis protein NfuA